MGKERQKATDRWGNWNSYHEKQELHRLISNQRIAGVLFVFLQNEIPFWQNAPTHWQKSESADREVGKFSSSPVVNYKLAKTSWRAFSEMKYEHTLMTQKFSRECVPETSRIHQEA